MCYLAALNINYRTDWWKHVEWVGEDTITFCCGSGIFLSLFFNKMQDTTFSSSSTENDEWILMKNLNLAYEGHYIYECLQSGAACVSL